MEASEAMGAGDTAPLNPSEATNEAAEAEEGAAPAEGPVATRNRSKGDDGSSDATGQQDSAAVPPAQQEPAQQPSNARSSDGARSSDARSSDGGSSEPTTQAPEGSSVLASAAAPEQEQHKQEQHKQEQQEQPATPEQAAAVDDKHTATPTIMAAASSLCHKETAVERLTTPTAMRMLKHLEQTQGGKQDWHIASSTLAPKDKRLSPDEMAAMVDRLCTPKHEEDNLPPKPHAVKLVFEGTKEVLVPVKESSRQDNIEYMANLYSRCQETRAKTIQSMNDKWLQPLARPIRSKPLPRASKAKAAAVAAAAK